MELLYDSAIQLLDTYPKEMNSIYQMLSHTPILVSALFTTAKVVKQFKCSSMMNR
jgi:hypothetical protein